MAAPPKPVLTVFELIIEVTEDGAFTPRIPLRIAGRDFLPGASFGPDFNPFGIPIEQWRGHPMYGHFEGTVLVLDAISRR